MECSGAGAEIIETHVVPEFAQAMQDLIGGFEIGDLGAFGDLEHEFVADIAAAFQFLVQFVDERGAFQRAARQVHCDGDCVTAFPRRLDARDYLARHREIKIADQTHLFSERD